jgi:hypothetical protein
VPLECSDLFAPANVTPLVGAPVTVYRDETTPPAYLDDVANEQLGVLPCEWAGEDAVEFGHLADLGIYIAPDSEAGFTEGYDAFVSDITKGASAPTLNSAGDKSAYWCEPIGLSGESPQCSAQMLIGSYWVTMSYSTVSPLTLAAATSNAQVVLSTVASKLKAAGSPGPRWKSPAASPPAFCTDTESTQQIRTLFGAADLAPFPSGTRTYDAFSIALNGPDASCTWTSKTVGAVDVELLAGGSWVFPGFTPVPSVDGIVRSYSPVTIPGVSSALMGCEEGACDAYLPVGTTAARISFGDMGAAKDIAALSQLAADIQKS